MHKWRNAAFEDFVMFVLVLGYSSCTHEGLSWHDNGSHFASSFLGQKTSSGLSSLSMFFRILVRRKSDALYLIESSVQGVSSQVYEIG